MRKLVLAVLALGVVAGPVTTVRAASTTSVTASPTSSVVGQTVTFTATFTSACPGAVTSHWFTIDGQGVNGTFVQNGQAGTETLSISTLTAGAHDISYYWKIQGTICHGLAPDMTYTVAAPPPPTLPPSPSPSPRPSHSPTPTPTPSPVAADASQQPSDSPLVGYFGGALILVVIVAGIGLMVVNRR